MPFVSVHSAASQRRSRYGHAGGTSDNSCFGDVYRLDAEGERTVGFGTFETPGGVRFSVAFGGQADMRPKAEMTFLTRTFPRMKAARGFGVSRFARTRLSV